MLGHQQLQSCNQGVMMWILFVKYGISNESVKSQCSFQAISYIDSNYLEPDIHGFVAK